jgi:hypothetical protein
VLRSNGRQPDHCALEDKTMSTKKEKRINTIQKAVVLMVSIAFAGATWAATDSASVDEIAATPRVSDSLHFKTGGRTNQRDPLKATISNDEFDALKTDGTRAKSATKRSTDQTAGAQSQAASFDFWFYDVDVDLFYDDDGDGFFYGVDLWFDVDTIYSAAEVYAVVYLSYEGGPWNEYAATEDFTIHDTDVSDDYVLVTELITGYPTGEYDLLIELFDAYNGDFLASSGPEDTSELAFLPLEDSGFDSPVVQRTVVITESGGGALGIWMLLGLLAARRFKA